jgi:hypothetical protein
MEPLSLIDRQQQLRVLLDLEPIVWRWSVRLGKGKGERINALRRYLMTLAEAQVGLVREVRRGWIADQEVILVVDEFAEALRAVRRPILSTRLEREVIREIHATIVRPQNSLT